MLAGTVEEVQQFAAEEFVLPGEVRHDSHYAHRRVSGPAFARRKKSRGGGHLLPGVQRLRIPGRRVRRPIDYPATRSIGRRATRCRQWRPGTSPLRSRAALRRGRIHPNRVLRMERAFQAYEPAVGIHPRHARGTARRLAGAAPARHLDAGPLALHRDNPRGGGVRDAQARLPRARPHGSQRLTLYRSADNRSRCRATGPKPRDLSMYRATASESIAPSLGLRVRKP